MKSPHGNLTFLAHLYCERFPYILQILENSDFANPLEQSQVALMQDKKVLHFPIC